MPIYEFYCRSCNTIYSFLSRRIQPEKRPPCPRCKQPSLDRQVSLFAATGKAREDDGGADDTGLPPVDEAKMEAAMEGLAREADSVSEEDPRKMADLMRKFSSMTGLELGSGMQEALNRLEAGEDPDRIEEELGDRLQAEEPFLPADGRQKGGRRKLPPPRRDTTLYEM